METESSTLVKRFTPESSPTWAETKCRFEDYQPFRLVEPTPVMRHFDDVLCLPISEDGDALDITFPRLGEDLASAQLRASDERRRELAACSVQALLRLEKLQRELARSNEMERVAATVHCDVKPANLVLVPGQTKVRLIDPDPGRKGSAGYQCWEQVACASGRSTMPPAFAWDRHALGQTLHMLLTGSPCEQTAGMHLEVGQRGGNGLKELEFDRRRAGDFLPAVTDDLVRTAIRDLLSLDSRCRTRVDLNGLEARLRGDHKGQAGASESAVDMPPTEALSADVPQLRRALILRVDVVAAIAGVVFVGGLIGTLVLVSRGHTATPGMVPVAATGPASVGTVLGEANQEPGDLDEGVRPIELAAYEIGRTEVSQAEWQAVMGEPNGLDWISANVGGPCTRWEGPSLKGAQLPMHCVTFFDAVRFANARSAAANLPPAYFADSSCTVPIPADEAGETRVHWERGSVGFRLPTDAEWEWAARGGAKEAHAHYVTDGTERPESVCGHDNVADRSWLRFRGADEPEPTFPCDDGFAGLAPVSSLRPNALGLFDVGGNVSEWTWSEQVDHPGKGEVRGGMWAGGLRERLSNRAYLPLSSRSQLLGLRLARTVEPAESDGCQPLRSIAAAYGEL